jgi:hypothetical protein
MANTVEMLIKPKSAAQFKAYLALVEYVGTRFMMAADYKDVTVTIDSIEYSKARGASPRMWTFQGKLVWHEYSHTGEQEAWGEGWGWFRHESMFSMNITSQGVADYMARNYGG